jgi:hypothetical protein
VALPDEAGKGSAPRRTRPRWSDTGVPCRHEQSVGYLGAGTLSEQGTWADCGDDRDDEFLEVSDVDRSFVGGQAANTASRARHPDVSAWPGTPLLTRLAYRSRA